MGSVIDTSADKISSILASLTLDEKISFLSGVDWWRTVTIDREGVVVPHLKLTDGPNGARGESYVSGIRAACFPCGTCLGATFDTEVLYQTGQAVAKEAQSKAANILLGPTLNVIRSPLGGRNYETYSEDPLVLGTLAAAYVRGCQAEGVAATPKHFVANEAENSRTTLSVQVDEQTLREIYLKPFQLVNKLSDPWCFMSSYNRVNGEYVADSARLVDGVLRKEWGFGGLVISDWMGTYSTGPGINAGVDLEMPAPTKWRSREQVQRVLDDGSVSVATIERSVRRVLELAQRLGRFENPRTPEPAEREADDPERDQFNIAAAADGMVLLKNAGAILPIPHDASVAMIGQHAEQPVLGGGGSARVNSFRAVSAIEGMRALGYDVTVAPGVPVFGAVPHADASLLCKTGQPSEQPLEQPNLAPAHIEWFNGSVVGRNKVHDEHVALPEYMIKEKWPAFLDQDYCTRITFDLVAPSTGNHVLSVVSTGRAVCFVDGVRVFERPQETKLRPESFYFFKRHLERRFTHPMQAGQRYTLRLESWACDPAVLHAPPVNGMMFQGSALRFHEHIDMDARVDEAVDAARCCRYAVVCVGTTNEFESEGYDRDTMDLTPDQCRLVRAVAAANANTVLVNFSGGPVTLAGLVGTVPALLQAWFPGQEGGHAVAAVLSGRVNPSGRLPLSWPVRIEDNPSFGNFPVGDDLQLHYAEGLDVGYRWYDRPANPDPLFAFGSGLSYTEFAVTSATLVGDGVLANALASVHVACEVANRGHCAGKAVLQCYVQSPPSASSGGRLRPVKELQAFAKVSIAPGETTRVMLELDKYSVSHYDADAACWRALPGDYRLLVGLSSTDVAHTLTLTVPAAWTWTGM